MSSYSLPSDTLDEIKGLIVDIMEHGRQAEINESPYHHAPDTFIERFNKILAPQVAAARGTDLTPNDMLLEQNKRLIEAGDALYERASYTGRSFDGTHRLLSAAAHWLDVRGKNSGEYQRELKEGRE